MKIKIYYHYNSQWLIVVVDKYEFLIDTWEGEIITIHKSLINESSLHVDLPKLLKARELII